MWTLLAGRMSHRVAYVESMIAGETVLEAGDVKAAGEVTAVTKEQMELSDGQEA